MKTIWIIDDDPAVCASIAMLLKRAKFQCQTFSHPSKLLETLTSQQPDLLLLDILYKDNSKGRRIFESLFKGSSPQLIFKFLDEATNIKEDLQIISSCPKSYFIKALFSRLF